MGLPSGTLWASENEEGYFTFDEAVEKFGNNLPARWQFCELVENCDCVFDIEKRALICKSKFNGNTIEFPALGCRYDTGGVLIVSAISASIGPALRAPIVGPLYGISDSTTTTNTGRYTSAHVISVSLSVYANLREVA